MNQTVVSSSWHLRLVSFLLFSFIISCVKSRVMLVVFVALFVKDS